MSDKDVTKELYFGNNDDESLPIERCICGQKFASWRFHITVSPESAKACPTCGRRFYFRNTIKVYQRES